MTKAEQLAEREALDAVRDAQEAAEYTNRLMRALDRATSRDFNMELTVVNLMFQVTDRDELENSWIMTATWDRASWELSDLEEHLDRKAAAKVEAQRKANLRRDALAKLTAEEKELLNLK
jgi:hypothetical protein